MIDCFEILSYDDPRPTADPIVFCDGTGGALYEAGKDLELSHWRPNRTPAEYRAGTSTEICFRFLDTPRGGARMAAVNNHVDVDGILSIYVLLHAESAQRNRQTILEAAEMGDFWGWGDPPAQRVFQGMTHLMNDGGEPRAIYDEAFRRIPAWIDGTDPRTSDIQNSLAPLHESVVLIDRGSVERRLVTPRLAHYVVTRSVAVDRARLTYVPGFNEAISRKALLWPHARARADAERVCLVSVEQEGGWLHDLWYPGYLWADTEGKWRPEELIYHDGMSSYSISDGRLIELFAELQRRETAVGSWSLGGTDRPFGQELQEQFPLVGRFLDASAQSAVSHLPAEQVAQHLASYIT